LFAFHAHGVKYLIVGGYAVNFSRAAAICEGPGLLYQARCCQRTCDLCWTNVNRGGCIGPENDVYVKGKCACPHSIGTYTFAIRSIVQLDAYSCE
jgi:hypothetical protein